MSDETSKTGAEEETPPLLPEELEPKKPKGQRMVQVVNTHRHRSFHLGNGIKIRPSETGRIPLSLFNKVKGQISWLKRAERGDVV